MELKPETPYTPCKVNQTMTTFILRNLQTNEILSQVLFTIFQYVIVTPSSLKNRSVVTFTLTPLILAARNLISILVGCVGPTCLMIYPFLAELDIPFMVEVDHDSDFRFYILHVNYIMI